MREQVLAKGASEKPVPSGESVGGEDQLRPFSPCLPGTPMAPGQGLAAGGPQCFTVGTVHSGICEASFQRLHATDTYKAVSAQVRKTND